MRIVVTGAGGMLGSDVVRAAELVNHEVVALEHSDLDVTDADAAASTIAATRPDAVVNCAAYTDVDGAEDDLGQAMKVNAEGAGAVATAAQAAGASVVYPSTDYVFDGTKLAPYVESDEPRPLSVYAQSKLAGEHATVEANPRHYVVRSAWLFGIAGGNFVDTMLRLGEDHGEVLVVRDQVGSPTYTEHLAEALVRLVDSDAYGIHHLAGTGECSWYEFAAEIFSQAGVECRVLSCTTEELGRPAPRPAYSALASERPDAILLPEWEAGLAAYLEQRAAVP
jgi:dTDP-4-dehydrorhamnose reductase